MAVGTAELLAQWPPGPSGVMSSDEFSFSSYQCRRPPEVTDKPASHLAQPLLAAAWHCGVEPRCHKAIHSRLRGLDSRSQENTFTASAYLRLQVVLPPRRPGPRNECPLQGMDTVEGSEGGAA